MAERKTPARKPKGEESAPAKQRKPAPKPKKAAAGDHGSQDDSLYTKPDLRARLKESIQAGTKGGRAGQWSARKSQLLAHEYEAEGGGYTNKKPSAAQKNLKDWTEEKWQTADGEKAVQGKETARYLPKAAWDKLSPAEKKATEAKKRAASKKGQQTVANTEPAKEAGRAARKQG